MKGIILSAGSGSRLLPLTQEVPKCLVAVDGRAILDHQLAALAAAGVERAVVVGGYRFPQIVNHLDLIPPPLPVSLVFNPFWAVSSSIGSVWAARAHLADDFCLMNGDTVFDPAVIRAALADAQVGVGLLVEPLARPELDDMLVVARDGHVRDVGKDLPPGRATHRSLGVVVGRAPGDAYVAALDAVIGAPNGIERFHHAIVAALSHGPGVAAIARRAGEWQEIDRPEDIAGWTRQHHPPR